MFRCPPRVWLPALVAGWLTVAAVAAADVPAGAPITDEAGLYSPGAVQKATQEIEGIERAEHKGLVIETYKGVPEERNKAFRDMARKARDEFFLQWADSRARARQVDGVYVLVCKSPAYAQAVLGPDTEERVFPERDRVRLAEELTPGGWRRNHDKELLRAVAWFHTQLHHNLRGGGSVDAGQVWPGALAVIAAMLLFWAVLALIRRALGPERTAEVGVARPRERLPAEVLASTGPPGNGAEYAAEGKSELEKRAEDF
jgi:hypothetical protein